MPVAPKQSKPLYYTGIILALIGAFGIPGAILVGILTFLNVDGTPKDSTSLAFGVKWMLILFLISIPLLVLGASLIFIGKPIKPPEVRSPFRKR